MPAIGQREPEPATSGATRRAFVKGAAATGAVLASGYVKPSLRSLGVPGALAATSGPPAPPPSPPPGITPGFTPGYWANSGKNPNAGGKDRWDQSTDGAPFIQTTVFSSFFTSGTIVDALTMYDVANFKGGASHDPTFVKRAGRELVTAALNAAFVLGYPYTVSQLKTMWANAVGTGAFETVFDTLAAVNTN